MADGAGHVLVPDENEGVVGVVAVSRATAGDDEVLNALGHACIEHIARAAHEALAQETIGAS